MVLRLNEEGKPEATEISNPSNTTCAHRIASRADLELKLLWSTGVGVAHRMSLAGSQVDTVRNSAQHFLRESNASDVRRSRHRIAPGLSR
jgi:hypothetical protein